MIIFVFDFDDTLFPSWYFSWNECSNQDKIAHNINTLITKASLYGKVHIITNAMKEWVRRCSTTLPNCNLCEMVEIFSTIDEGYIEGENHYLWKTPFFKAKLSSYFQQSDEMHHLISFGDSPGDRLAALSLKAENIFVKNILFPALPTLDQLLCCQEIIHDWIESIVGHQGDLDLSLKINPIETQAQK